MSGVEPFGIFLKSYAHDAEYAHRFLESFRLHNADGLPLFLVIPEADVDEFRDFESFGATIIFESAFDEYLVDYPIHGNSPSYVNHQIIRLAFWELGLCENYLNVDSEIIFVRNFHRSDFMFDTHTPYTFLSEDFELQVEPEYHSAYWVRRVIQIENIRTAIDLSEMRNLTVHGMGVYSARVLESLKTKFLKPRGMTYSDALEISPIPPTWYNFWLLKDRTIPIIMREPVFKTFHNASQHLEYVLKGIRAEDISRGYAGVIVNSGYSRKYGLIDIDQPKSQLLGSYVSLRVLTAALVIRWARRMPRVVNLLRRIFGRTLS
jgi:hypothetical protein